MVAAPSGGGKTSLVRAVLAQLEGIRVSVSYTTRSMRPGDVDGVDYHFISETKFKELISQKKFYEYAKIFNNYYGTLKKTVDEISKTNDLIFDIDWQGTKQLSKFKNLNLIKIYLLPPSKKELKNRLIKRNQESEEEVAKRFKAYDEDILHWEDYDYVLINENLENCYKQIEKIISINKNTNSPSHKTQ